MLNQVDRGHPLIDQFGRKITYLRLSVTDRCDLRCTYCMAERMTFLPKKEVLTLEELGEIAEAFIRRGVSKIRITGGEPLVRPGIIDLFNRVGQKIGAGLEELTLTTNATQMTKYAHQLHEAGVRRVNISLDSRDPATFLKVTRKGNLPAVLEGIEAALDARLKVKINMVALKGVNESEIPSMIDWAHAKGMDLTLIEVMPMGETGEHRFDQFLPLSRVRKNLEQIYSLEDEIMHDTNGGPSQYARALETGGRIGFITPLSNNFCATCNRVRVTCTGRIYMCLGQEDYIDLMGVVRGEGDIDQALDTALLSKPEKHDFSINKNSVHSGTTRHMSTTGG